MTAAPIFAVQYLESPYSDATPASVRARLRSAFERLPISLVLLGWELPFDLEEAVAEETALHNAKLFRWQPLLTGDFQTTVPSEWAVKGLGRDPIPAHHGLPEFSFICPNQDPVSDFLAERVERVAACGLFQGLFLDRIRFPSPCINPFRDLACFCEHCFRQAADFGIDLKNTLHTISTLPAEAIVRNLFSARIEGASQLDDFLNFREASITRSVWMVANLARGLGLSIGLDCFSPSLSRMVGQDLSALAQAADWVKIMVYPRVFGPAGIPFELLGLANWLNHHGMGEKESMQFLTESCGLPLPKNKAKLNRDGLDSNVITQEILRGKEMGVSVLLAGIAMVNMDKVHMSSSEQIRLDLKASRNADGMVISWDLWLTPLSYLDEIRNFWC